ncbi:DNA topoisomerase 2-beta [Tyrophagus putrescentiae]|nr:DNA topoisomerase 2-beta [Tyrophagus putrescentiae]
MASTSSGPAIEQIYQKKSQLEHILLRPDSYIGSIEKETKPMWVWDVDSEGNGHMVNREITYVPGLYKIFDEILVNAADNKQRDKKMNVLRIDINAEKNEIVIYNNGKGIPVTMHKDEKIFVPTMIFGHLLTSSNYNDDEKKVVGGRNGYGAKLCNIFSEKFKVETSSKEFKKAFSQVWTDNMSKAHEAKVTSVTGEDFTRVTFKPDLSKFKMDTLDKDIVALFSRRAFDVAATSKGVKVFLNGDRLPVTCFKDYVNLFLNKGGGEDGGALNVAHEVVNDRWEVAVATSEKGFQQISFVNSIATTRGGKHVDHFVETVVSQLTDLTKKKLNKQAASLKPHHVKNQIWVFVNCLIENPTFDSQTKETMTLQVKNFGSKCSVSPKFLKALGGIGAVENICEWAKFKADSDLKKKGGKKGRVVVEKLIEANFALQKGLSHLCTLILTEGDSAKTLVVSGLGEAGRDRYGVFPLRGKLLNVREATHKQIMENKEINNIIKIVGLQFKKVYETEEDLKSLRYGKLMIMTDQDQDGSHIKGLLINFIHHFWPSLLKLNFLEEFITPIVKVTKKSNKNMVKAFYSLPEFQEWKAATPNYHTWDVKYYKGLGTSTSAEGKEYFADLARHRIVFRYGGADDDHHVKLAFSKKMIEERKEWLTGAMEERKRRRELGLPELYLYGKDTRAVTYQDFVNQELVLFSNMDNERSIPSLVDGLKPGQRKVIFTCFKRNDKKEVKVAQLAGSVGEKSAYHHGEVSLQATIVNMAQDFVGSNNINLLKPNGQFGTRLTGGKDAASARYIFTMLSPLARKIFPVKDDPLMKYLYDDNLRIEPEYYVPIIPMVLVNGAEGIGTGWSTKIPNYDPRVLAENVKRRLRGEELLPLEPWYKGFKGTFTQVEPNKYVVSGEAVMRSSTSFDITELPIYKWTQPYRDTVLEPMLSPQNGQNAPLLTDVRSYYTDVTVHFIVEMTAENLQKVVAEGIHKVFKLQTTISTTSMVLFDGDGCLRRFDSPKEIFDAFFPVRMRLYEERKRYYEGLLQAEALFLDNQVRFIREKNDGIIKMEKVKEAALTRQLIARNYDSDPVKAWKRQYAPEDEANKKKDGEENDAEEEDSAEEERGEGGGGCP